MKTFDEYEQAAEATRVFPSAMQIVYPALGLCGESGEVAEKVKKLIRDGDTWTPEERCDRLQAIIVECGDVLWYLNAILLDLGSSLSEAAALNIAKLTDRKERGVVRGDGDSR